MRKIPTLLVRDPNDRAHVTDQLTPGCEWVLNGSAWDETTDQPCDCGCDHT